MSTRTTRVAPDAQRDRALAMLFFTAGAHQLIQHGPLCQFAGVPSHNQAGDLLRAVNNYCADHDFPPLGALVVRYDGQPGSNYHPSAAGIEADRERCWQFSGSVPTISPAGVR